MPISSARPQAFKPSSHPPCSPPTFINLPHALLLHLVQVPFGLVGRPLNVQRWSPHAAPAAEPSAFCSSSSSLPSSSAYDSFHHSTGQDISLDSQSYADDTLSGGAFDGGLLIDLFTSAPVPDPNFLFDSTSPPLLDYTVPTTSLDDFIIPMAYTQPLPNTSYALPIPCSPPRTSPGSESTSSSSKPTSRDDYPTDKKLKRKRELNNIAAKKSRQKRIDRIDELEEEVAAVKTERDDLKLQLAVRNAEVAMLREMLGK